MKKLQILGPGCPKCKKLSEVTEEAARSIGIAYTIAKVTDIREIMKFNVMMTPALAVDGVVKVAGRIPSKEELRKILAE